MSREATSSESGLQVFALLLGAPPWPDADHPKPRLRCRRPIPRTLPWPGVVWSARPNSFNIGGIRAVGKASAIETPTCRRARPGRLGACQTVSAALPPGLPGRARRRERSPTPERSKTSACRASSLEYLGNRAHACSPEAVNPETPARDRQDAGQYQATGGQREALRAGLSDEPVLHQRVQASLERVAIRVHAL